MAKVKLTIRFTYSKTIWEDEPEIQNALYALGMKSPITSAIKHELIEIVGQSKVIHNMELTKEAIKELITEKYYNVQNVNITHQLL
jgi:hypothetical protein